MNDHSELTEGGTFVSSTDNSCTTKMTESDVDDANDAIAIESTDLNFKYKKRKKNDGNDSTRDSKRRDKSNQDLYKPPTVEELNQLRETQNLFHSNLFRLQIEEMLNEVRIKEKYKKIVDVWFTKLKESIESIEETENYELTNEEPLKELHIQVPTVSQLKDKRGGYRFLKPSNISIIGSYGSGTAIGPNVTIDIMVEMPAKMFQKLDHQNYRYLWKRAIYLSYIASNIQNDIVTSAKFVHFGENRMPILKIVPNGKLSKVVTAHLHVAVQQCTFKLTKFLPGKNCVRPKWFLNGKEDADKGAPVPTPHYNSLILHDLTMLQTNIHITKVIKEYPSLRDGIILLKIWLHQRQLINGYDAFGSHVLTMFVLYLLHTKKLNTFMSSYQIIRHVWNSLVQCNWSMNGITLCQHEESQNETISVYQEYYDCVFLDTTGYHNLAANISMETLNWVRNEADLAVQCLDNAHVDCFQVLFARKVPLHSAFDQILCIHNKDVMQNIVETKASFADKIDFGINKRRQILKSLITVLKKGLGNKVLQIGILPTQIEEWNATDTMPADLRTIFIGLQLNPEFCFNIVDRGPPANLPEALTFRQFWGGKSELRRFQDGSVCEAVVWGKGRTLSERRSVCKKIVQYLLKSKFDISKNQYLYISDQMEALLKLKGEQVTKFTYGTGEEATLKLMLSFNALEKELLSLTDLPLSITGVQGCSAVFRYTDVFPPLATLHSSESKISKEGENCLLLREKMVDMVPKYTATIEATIQLALHGKWPDELEAVQKVKAAFHIQIAECLRRQHHLKAQAHFQHVDVMKDGFAFRLRVVHQKEIALLKQEIGTDGTVKYRDNEKSIKLEQELFHLPKLTGALHGLHFQQPSYGPACCLAKRWLSAHMIDTSHMPDIAVELLLASMYLVPEPYKSTQTPQVAFIRFLEILARNPWSADPVIVNFNNEMSREAIVAVENLFGTARSTLPPLFIATPYDTTKSSWTRKCPSVLILNRISSLAQESLKILKAQELLCTFNYMAIFRPPLSEYDCLIHLKPLLNPRRLQAIDLKDDQPITRWHHPNPHSKQKIPILNYNPVDIYLEELREGYSEFALFFHDTYGGSVIGVLLKPSPLKCQEFKVSNINCRILDVDNKLSLNLSAMVEDFYIMGRGLVKNIEIQSKRVALS